ncbi:antibiotic resistance protein (antibiotic efflux protein) [Oceanobacillus iheyensis HTE831]|uniref:Antibiotic resistance protein (Antibiotic efflux protein) n=1 Tax=Oceanobacillus iheyensis (strain DSM 14371 / CIP 107618 / JCM 11309 / KCTC 3954 / HTE831) TaxID=221109 RepID=Q8CXK1_OCEIH|nr:MFS transporter [Oceanobacillus iheyensis]BAC13153.1 antibiotic resistance protein (antibiotic efflux protein) [Oceanobacillus iheyensis HTE831]
MNLEKIWTKSFISISLVQLLIFLSFYALLTTLPIYVMDQLGGNEAEGGLVVTVMLLAAIIIRFFSAKLLDKIGKKRGLIISVALFMITSFLYLLVETYTSLLALRFLHGFSFGIITTATGAIAADIIPASRKGAGLGYFAMAMNVAVVLGPFIGLTLIQYVSFHTLFFILGVLMIVALINSMMVQVEEQIVEVNDNRQRLSIHDFIETRALPIAIIASLVSLSYASVMSFISVYASSIGLASTASFFFLVFAAVMLITRPSIGRSFDLKGPRFVLLPCLMIFSVGLIALSITNSSWMLLLAAGLIGLGYGSILPGFQTIAIQLSPDSRSSHATSTFFILYDLGIAIGSFVWGLIVSEIGFSNLYLVAAAIVVIALFLFEFYYRRPSKKEVNIADVQ